MLPPSLLLSLLSVLPVAILAAQVPLVQPHDTTFGAITLQLRHLHAATNTSRVLFADVSPRLSSQQAADDTSSLYTLRTSVQKTFRPVSFDAHARARTKAMRGETGPRNESVEALTWEEDEVFGPDVTSRETLLQLAKMTNNAYAYTNETEWYDLGGDWDDSYPFGWEDDADGFRGHVFASTDNKTIVISIKGTSAPYIGSGGPTVKKDKLNNNLLFSCCCAKVGFSWSPVCGCWAGGWKCDRDCLQASLVEDSLFYPVGTNLYNNVSYLYPEANIWVIGHSLGGALASLLGVTFGTPVVAFEAPGEKMAAERLHLPSPPSTQHVTHVYHTADPVAMGTCNGVLSTCAIAGYAMESRCHLGKAIVYDTVTKLNWSVSLSAHSIKVIVEQLLAEDWTPDSDDVGESALRMTIDTHQSGGIGRVLSDGAVPIAKPEEDCVECYKWEYGDFLDPGNWLGDGYGPTCPPN